MKTSTSLVNFEKLKNGNRSSCRSILHVLADDATNEICPYNWLKKSKRYTNNRACVHTPIDNRHSFFDKLEVISWMQSCCQICKN